MPSSTPSTPGISTPTQTPTLTPTFFDGVRQDLRYGLRQMRRAPGVTAIIVLSLALGIGANTAIFSLIDAILLKQLPVARPDELVVVTWHAAKWPAGVMQSGFSIAGADGRELYPNFSFAAVEQLRAESKALFTTLAVVREEKDLTVAIDGQPRLANVELVTTDYFSMLGVTPQLGRLFAPSDSAGDGPRDPGARAEVVLGHRYWARELGRDPRVVGRTMTIGTSAFTIVGVAPASFDGMRPGRSVDLWLPLAEHPGLSIGGGIIAGQSAFAAPGRWWLTPIGRLAPGVTPARAAAALDALFARTLPEASRAALAANPDQTPRIVLAPGGQGMPNLRRQVSQSLALMAAMVGLVLLIACANVATLLLGRAAARRKEIAIRLAIGASRGRLIRQLLTESVLLAGVGGALGLLLAASLARLLPSLLARGGTPIALTVSLDPLVLAFTVAISLATGLAFGLAPALRATRVTLAPSSAKGASDAIGASASERSPRAWPARALVATQVALSMLLLIGAGLFVRTVINLERQPLGFDPHRLLIFGLDATQSGLAPDRVAPQYAAVLDRLRQTPGVQAATVLTTPPMAGWSSNMPVAIIGAEDPALQRMPLRWSLVGPGYLETMGMRLRAGRDLTPRDTAAAPRVAIVTEAFARKAFGEANAIGRRFRFVPELMKGAEFEIVGVAEEAKQVSLDEAARPVAYVPYQQSPLAMRSIYFAVRTSAEPMRLLPAIEQAVHAVAPALPLIEPTMQTSQIARSIGQERTFAQLASAFGALALLLACIGLHGTLGYAVARRTPEIGIRLALGATRAAILRMILRDALIIVGLGLAAGLGAGLLTTRFLERWLFGLTATDAGTLAGAAAVLLVVTLLAGWLPARRAAKVEPVIALRGGA